MNSFFPIHLHHLALNFSWKHFFEISGHQPVHHQVEQSIFGQPECAELQKKPHTTQGLFFSRNDRKNRDKRRLKMDSVKDYWHRRTLGGAVALPVSLEFVGTFTNVEKSLKKPCKYTHKNWNECLPRALILDISLICKRFLPEYTFFCLFGGFLIAQLWRSRRFGFVQYSTFFRLF